MKSFNLDSVLKYRQLLEDIAQTGLVRAREAKAEVEQHLLMQQTEYTNVLLKLEDAQLKGIAINDLIRMEEHLNYLQSDIHNLTTELEKKQKIMEQARLQLLKKCRDRQVIEKLKSKHEDERHKYLTKKNASLLDEIAIIHHNK